MSLPGRLYRCIDRYQKFWSKSKASKWTSPTGSVCMLWFVYYSRFVPLFDAADKTFKILKIMSPNFGLQNPQMGQKCWFVRKSFELILEMWKKWKFLADIFMIQVIEKIYLTLRLVLMNRKYLVSSSNAHQMHLSIQNFKFYVAQHVSK